MTQPRGIFYVGERAVLQQPVAVVAFSPYPKMRLRIKGHQPSDLVGRSVARSARHVVARDPQLLLPLSLLAGDHCKKTLLDWNVLAELCFD